MPGVRRFPAALWTQLCAAALIIAAVLAGEPAVADVLPPSNTLTPYQQDLLKSATLGPASIRLRDQAVLSLPAGAAFIPQGPARALMQRYGNKTDDNFLGIIAPWEESDWFITLVYAPVGYVADDDAKNWNADEILKNIRDNTEANNADRVKRGIPALDVIGWVERPHYDNVHHRLIWSIQVKENGAQAGSDNAINYRMIALGRQGYIAVNMVTNASAIEARKPIAATMLSDVNFTGGKRYGDFNSSTDHVAEYGLAALIGGVVAHKLGFFALIAAFLVKGAKVIVVAVLGAFAAVRRFFRRGKPEPVAATPAPLAPPAAPVAPPAEPPA